MNDPRILEELLLRRRAATHLGDYAQFALGVTPAEHHRLICQYIDDLLNDEYDELIINSPPGSAKSTYTSHALGSYFVGRWPDKNIILATHTSDLSERWSRKVRNTVDSAEHHLLFPSSSLSRDSTAVSRWATSLGGEFLAAGVGGSILGFRADLGVIDDPIGSFEEAQSLTQLVKIHNWYETDFMTRLKPRAKVVLICQRLSPNDLAGYMLKRNAENPTRRQRVLILQMEATDSPPCPLGRAPGDRLWADWYTAEMVEDFKRDEFKWKTLFQQQPPSEDGSWVSPADILYRPTPERLGKLYGMSDIALSVNTGDFTTHFVVSVDQEGDWDIVHGERYRNDSDYTSDRVVALQQTYNVVEWLADDDNMSKVMMPLVHTKARSKGVGAKWNMIPMRGQDKETRAAGLRGMFKRHKVYMPEDASWARWLKHEILTFPNALGEGVDDGIDALGCLGRRLLAVSRAPRVVPPPPPRQGWTLDELWSTAPGARKERI